MWLWKNKARPQMLGDITSLPDEIWQQIFLFSGIKATATACCVSKRMNELCKDDLLWKQFVPTLLKGTQLAPASLDKITFAEGVAPCWFEYCKSLTQSECFSSDYPTTNNAYIAPDLSELFRWGKKILLKLLVLGNSGAGKISKD